MDSSAISFKINNAGIMVNGTFDGLVAEINFNPKKLKRSRITASVEAGSVDTGIRLRNKHLCRSDYFNVESYPRIRMQSLNFQKKEEGQFLGDFILSLKGKVGKVSVPISVQKEGTNNILSGDFDIDRRDYDIGGKSLLLADEVQISIWIRAREEN